MKKFITVIFILINVNCFAQDEDFRNTYDPSKWFTGGSVSVSIGGYEQGFLAGLNPHFGYTIANWIDAAVVANFQYSTARDQFDNKYRSTIYGAGIFTRMYPVRFLFVQVQPEYNFISQKFIPSAGETLKENFSVASLLIGAGYTPSRSDQNTFSYFSLLFDVLGNINSPYVDGNGKIVPVIRAGINIGLKKKHPKSK